MLVLLLALASFFFTPQDLIHSKCAATDIVTLQYMAVNKSHIMWSSTFKCSLYEEGINWLTMDNTKIKIKIDLT